MIRFLLSLFVPFRWFIEKMGADYTQFIQILRLKLTLDNRRMKGIGGNPKNSMENALAKQSFTQLFMGLLFISFLAFVKSPFTFYYFSHSFTMVMMAMMIISEFSTVLFDTADNNIMQPLPVKGNTISLARNAHVFLYLSLMAFNISIFTVLLAIYKFGIASGLIFVVTIFLNVLFTLFLANILYLGIMRLASGEKLKNLLMYFQVVIAILFMAGYQFGLNMVDKSVISNMILPVRWYTFLAPPAFFSGLVEALSTLNFDTHHLIFIAEALFLPVIAIYLTGKYLTPIFNRKLMDLEQGDRTSKVKIETARKSLWYRIAALIFVKGPEERAAFKLMWKMTGRERLFKQTLLPAFGYVVIMIVMPLLNKHFSFNELVHSDRYLLILYAFMFFSAILPTALLTGNNPHAAWIFKALPFGLPANFFKGCIKAAFVRFFVPFYIGLGIIICGIWGIHVLPDVFIVLLVIYLFTSMMQFQQIPVFPFTMEKIAPQGSERAFKFLGMILVAVILGFLHRFLLHWFAFANLLLIPVYLGGILYLDRVFVYRKITWKAVDLVNNYS